MWGSFEWGVAMSLLELIDDPDALSGDLSQLLHLKYTFHKSIDVKIHLFKKQLEELHLHNEAVYKGRGPGHKLIIPFITIKAFKLPYTEFYEEFDLRTNCGGVGITFGDYNEYLKGSDDRFDLSNPSVFGNQSLYPGNDWKMETRKLIDNTIRGYEPIMAYFQKIEDFGKKLEAAIQSATLKQLCSVSVEEELSQLRKENREMRTELTKLQTALTDTLDLLQSIARAR